MDNAIIAAVDDALPKFNRHLLVDYPNEQVTGIADFLSMAFEEAMKFLRNRVKYKGYRILSPQERVHFELATQRAGGAPVTNSELQLIAFDFVYKDKVVTTHLYVPYMIDNQIIIRNTRYGIMYGITEKVFSRGPNGLTVRVLRQPLHFWRGHHFILESMTSDYKQHEFVVGAKLHTHAARKKDVQTTITHYLLCKFGINGTLQRFGIAPGDVTFVTEINEKDVDKFEYFAARKISPRANGPQVLMRVAKDILQDPTHRKLIANILYLLSKRYKHSVADLYDKTNFIYRIYLGEILYASAVGEAMARSQADTHMHSVDFFLDPVTKHRTSVFGIHVEDIWDLLQYIFTEIDRIMVKSTHQDRFEKRMTITDNLLIDIFISRIYWRIYAIDQNPNRLSDKLLAKTLSLKATAIRGISRAPNVEMVGNSIINGNGLLSFMLRKIQLSGAKAATPSLQSPDIRFDPSIAVVETLIGFAGKSPAINGLINPYAAITAEGGILRPEEYADEIQALEPFLPYG